MCCPGPGNNEGPEAMVERPSSAIQRLGNSKGEKTEPWDLEILGNTNEMNSAIL